MKIRIILLSLLAHCLVAQISNMAGYNGMGYSTHQCVDRDGDGYGTGATALISTTIASAVSPGVQTVTPASMTASVTATTTSSSTVLTAVSNPSVMQPGMTVSGAGIPAGATVTQVKLVGSDIAVTISAAATASATVTVSVGIGVGVALRVDLGPLQEKVIPTAVTGSTFTAVFRFSHAGGVTVMDQGCAGPDADDLDATVQTGAQGVSKYGTLTKLINKLGYYPTHIWYLAPASPTAACIADRGGSGPCTGSDSNSCEDSPSTPCLTGPHIIASVTAGHMILAADGWNGRLAPGSGSSGSPIIMMAYPGELPVIDGTAISGANIIVTGQSWLVVDGFRFTNGSCIGTGNSDYITQNFHDNVFRRLDGSECFRGMQSNGIHNSTLEYSAFHDNAEAGVYWSAPCIPSFNPTIRGVISYRNAYSGIHINGVTSGALLEDNIVYNNSIEGITLQSGSNNAIVRGNIASGSGGGEMTLYNYHNSFGLGTNCDASYYDIAAMSWSSAGGGTVTYTPIADHLGIGDTVTVSGVVPSGYNCTGCTVTANTGTSMTISYAVASNPGTYTGCVGPQLNPQACLAINADNQAYTITGATWSAGTATVQLQHKIQVGQYVFISQSNPAGYNSSGIGVPVAAVTSTTVSFALASDPGAYVSGAFSSSMVGDESGNLIENNTFYHGQYNRDGGSPGQFGSIIFLNSSDAMIGSLGNNTFRNNIFVNYGDTSTSRRLAPIYYSTNAGNSSGIYIPTSTFANNLTWQTNGISGGTAAYGQYATCSPACSGQAVYDQNGAALNGGPALSFTTGSISGGVHGNPKFVNSSPSNYASPFTNDFRLLDTSPGLHAGSTGLTTSRDWAGRAYTEGAPSIGALERNLYGIGWNTLVGAGFTTAVAPPDGAPSNLTCISSPSNGTITATPPCSGANGYPYSGYMSQEIGAWTDGWLREAGGKPHQLCWWGGGHRDGLDNSIYCVSFNRASPTIARVFGPSQVYGGNCSGSACDFVNTVPILSDGAPNVTHSGGSLTYDPSNDQLHKYNGAAFGPNGVANWDSEIYKFDGTGWVQIDGPGASVDCTDHGTGYSSCTTYPSLTIGRQSDPYAFWHPHPQGGFAGNNIYDPLTKTYWVYTSIAGGFSQAMQYYPSVNQYVNRTTNSEPALSTGAVNASSTRTFISGRRWWLFQDYTGTTSTAWYYDLSSFTSTTPQSGGITRTSITLDSSCDGWAKTPGAGMAYDPIRDVIVTYPSTSGGGTYYTMVPGTWVCTAHALTGGPSTTAAYLLGKWQKSNDLDLAVIVNGVGSTNAQVLSFNPSDPVATAVNSAVITGGKSAIGGKVIR